MRDIVVLINGRPELADELAGQADELRTYVAQELAALIDEPMSNTSSKAPSPATETSPQPEPQSYVTA